MANEGFNRKLTAILSTDVDAYLLDHYNKPYKSQKPYGRRWVELALHLFTVILYLMVLLSVVGSKKVFASSADFGYDSYQKCYITNLSNRALTVHIWKLSASDEFSDYIINVSDYVTNPSEWQLISELRLPACTFNDVSCGSWYSPINAPNTVGTRLGKGEYLLSMGCVDVIGRLDWWKTRFSIGEDTGLPVEIYITEFCAGVGKIVYYHPIIPLEGDVPIEPSNDICIFP
jgi:hypothetical protein